MENNNKKKLVHLFIESLPIKSYNHSQNNPKLKTNVDKGDKNKIVLKETPKNKVDIIINNLLYCFLDYI
jgi:hypothetical protein